MMPEKQLHLKDLEERPEYRFTPCAGSRGRLLSSQSP